MTHTIRSPSAITSILISSSRLFILMIPVVLLIASSPRAAGQSGGGATGPVGLVQRSGRAGTLTYPKPIGNSSSDPTRSKTVPLREPASFDSPGIYVWKNSDGSWNLRLISASNGTTFGADVRAAGPIVIDTSETFDGALLAVSGSRLEFIANHNVNQILRFRSDADWIEFDLRVNGVQHPESVFLGSSRITPNRVPFRIAEQATDPRGTVNGRPAEVINQQLRPSSDMNFATGSGAGPGQRRP